jgi:hypothetical protein
MPYGARARDASRSRDHHFFRVTELIAHSTVESHRLIDMDKPL